MIAKIHKFIILFIGSFFCLCTIGNTEPFIVLSYNNEQGISQGDGKNEFSLNANHSADYLVKKGDSLNSILKTFYKGSGLDRRFIQLSIVIANPHAFAKNNPNFLFSDKRIYLPGKADIEKLLTGTALNNEGNNRSGELNANKIYFFGG